LFTFNSHIVQPMKKTFIILLFFVIACSGNKSDKGTSKVTMDLQKTNLVNYRFKIDGLQDSIISDSIWKMIFKVQGIDKLVISKSDSTVTFTIDPKLVSNEAIKAEITKRGGKIINTLPR
jgi:hypothetical protein